LRDIGGVSDAFAALAFDQLPGFVRRRRVDIDREHARAFAGIEHGARLAVAPAGPARARTENQRHFPAQSHHRQSR
jgi:hypothetical protein